LERYAIYNAEMTEIKYPLSIKIIKLCEKLIDTHFKAKGNSWASGQQTPMPFLFSKLQEEYSEFLEAFRDPKYEVAKEGADLINVIAMLMRRYDKSLQGE